MRVVRDRTFPLGARGIGTPCGTAERLQCVRIYGSDALRPRLLTTAAGKRKKAALIDTTTR